MGHRIKTYQYTLASPTQPPLPPEETKANWLEIFFGRLHSSNSSIDPGNQVFIHYFETGMVVNRKIINAIISDIVVELPTYTDNNANNMYSDMLESIHVLSWIALSIEARDWICIYFRPSTIR
jgi:hypothetical protein